MCPIMFPPSVCAKLLFVMVLLRILQAWLLPDAIPPHTPNIRIFRFALRTSFSFVLDEDAVMSRESGNRIVGTLIRLCEWNVDMDATKGEGASR
mmetsp:Transcript_23916/g.34991  ORF Transcript_23916/g.34991 Transcript_23916/m.34991 type:complete len:94 (+) Transcript_23916:728-1009(+)